MLYLFLALYLVIVWAKILAGENVRPGSFSLRTLEILRNISPTEAQIFSRLSAFVVHLGATHFVVKPGTNLNSILGVRYDEIISCGEAGLLVTNELSFSITPQPEIGFMVGNKIVTVVARDAASPQKLQFTMFRLTAAGVQLFGLLKGNAPSAEYLKEIARQVALAGADTFVADVIKRESDDTALYDNKRKVEP